jgi:AcrR family transcriptional regulator
MATRRAQRETTRDRVLDAARHLFFERGFEATTIRDIATAADVSVGTVIAVGDKRALLVTTFDDQIAAIQDRPPAPAEAAAARPTDADDAVGRVMELLEPFLAMYSANPALARDYGAVLMGGRHGTGVFGTLVTAFVDRIRAVLEQDGADADDAAAAGRTIYLAYLGVLFAWAGRGTDDAAEARDDLRQVVSFAVHTTTHHTKGKKP